MPASFDWPIILSGFDNLLRQAPHALEKTYLRIRSHARALAHLTLGQLAHSPLTLQTHPRAADLAADDDYKTSSGSL